MAADRDIFFAGLTALICLEIAPPADPALLSPPEDEVTRIFQRPTADAAAPTPVRRSPTLRLLAT